MNQKNSAPLYKPSSNLATNTACCHPELDSGSQRKKSAFTLIELLVVIVIIGILATIGVASFNDYQEKARWAAMSVRITQEKKLFVLKCLGEGKNLADCPVSYVAFHISNAETGDWRYGASPSYCEDFCASKTNESLNQYFRVATKEEAIWFAQTANNRCTAGWHYMDNSAQLFSSGYPMYENQIITNCGPINTGDVARYVAWSVDQNRETQNKADCACISYPQF